MSDESTNSGGGSGAARTQPRLLDQVHNAIRRRYFSRRTEEAYVHWIKRFIYFSDKRHPATLGELEITAFLNHLAVKRKVAASTQNQALSALLFLYKEVLGRELAWLDGLKRVQRPPRLPTVLTRAEVQRLLAQVEGTRWLLASLLYGAGLRVMECLRLRVKDVDLAYKQILVRDGKGAKDRVTMLPETVLDQLRGHLERVRVLHARDLNEGYGETHLPYALGRKYPRAGREWCWQYIFPSKNRSADPDDGVIRRHHLDESVPQRAVKEAARLAGITKHVSCHSTFLRNAPARERLRHPNGAGTARALRRFHDDLYACAEQGRARGQEPARSCGATARGVSRGVIRVRARGLLDFPTRPSPPPSPRKRGEGEEKEQQRGAFAGPRLSPG